MSKLPLFAGLAALAIVLYLILYISLPQTEVRTNEDYRFEAWKLHYNKDYTEEEAIYRLNVFTENLKYINEYNNKQNDIILGLNKFADLTKEEFDLSYKGYIPRED